MNYKKITIMAVGVALLFAACKKEERPVATDDLKIPELFAPPENADPQVKSLYKDYGVWVRMDFNHWREVTNGILFNDVNNSRFGATKIDDDKRQEAITYSKTLLSNFSQKFVGVYFPLELFFVKTYNGSVFATDLQVIGRSRIVLTWPNKMRGALTVTNPETHYYRDSVLTRAVLSSIAGTIVQRMDNPIEGFEMAGKPYDNGVASDKIRDQFLIDRDMVKRDAAYDELARTGGYITGPSSRSFASDFPQWFTLMATESYANIKKKYLDNNEMRTRKYEILVKFFNSYGWDIQATGNKYRQELDKYK